MGKLLFWVLVLVAIFGIARFTSLVQRRQDFARKASEQRALEQTEIVQCAHCGVYVPGDEAVRQGGRTYCSPEHRDAG